MCKDGIVGSWISEECGNKMIDEDYSLHIKYFDLDNHSYTDYFKLTIVRLPKGRYGLDLSFAYSNMLLDLLNMSKHFNIETGHDHHSFNFRELWLDNYNGVITIGVYSDTSGKSIDLTKDQVLQVINTLQEMINDECKENE